MTPKVSQPPNDNIDLNIVGSINILGNLTFTNKNNVNKKESKIYKTII